jgi:hypothetical protein
MESLAYQGTILLNEYLIVTYYVHGILLGYPCDDYLPRNPTSLPMVLKKKNVTSTSIFSLCLETGNGL